MLCTSCFLFPLVNVESSFLACICVVFSLHHYRYAHVVCVHMYARPSCIMMYVLCNWKQH